MKTSLWLYFVGVFMGFALGATWQKNRERQDPMERIQLTTKCMMQLDECIQDLEDASAAGQRKKRDR